jgi:hypothetical protein
MPFVTSDVVAMLADELRPGMKAAVAFAEGHLEPLLGASALVGDMIGHPVASRLAAAGAR